MLDPLQHLSNEVRAALATAELRIQNPVGAEYLWKRVLNAGERKRLGDRFEKAYQRHGGTIGIWLQLRKGTPQRAIVDVAHALNLLSDSDWRWLLRELGEPEAPLEGIEWRKELGELRWNGEVIRKVAVGRAKNVVAILDAFHESGWPERMDDPIPNGDDQRLRDSVKVLNRRLHKIRFYADGTGTGLYWKVL